MSSRQEIIEILRKADAVCFDVDSTVCVEEGIDELAEFCGKGEKIREMTSQAMAGNVDFRTALEMRLDIIRPSVNSINQMLSERPFKLTEGIAELIKVLQESGKVAFLVSGGFELLIKPMADQLSIPEENIFSNKIFFDQNGDYVDFDRDQFTSKSGGKAAVIDFLKKSRGFETVVMIGDGATDMEACPPADAFIGFGGNVIRPSVQEKAAWFITDFQELINALIN